jgi:hypothetical protein
VRNPPAWLPAVGESIHRHRNRSGTEMKNKRWVSALCVLTLAAVTLWAPACATVGTQKTGGQDVLTRSQIAEVGQMNALDLIRLKRPLWLRVRGQNSLTQLGSNPVIVYLDNVRLGTVDALANIDSDEIESIHYYDARQAQVRYGSGNMSGVIAVTSRHGH